MSMAVKTEIRKLIRKVRHGVELVVVRLDLAVVDEVEEFVHAHLHRVGG